MEMSLVRSKERASLGNKKKISISPGFGGSFRYVGFGLQKHFHKASKNDTLRE